MEIKHDIQNGRVELSIEGQTAVVKYRIDKGALDVYHTFVPSALNGRGVAATLVRYAYDYAMQHNLRAAATCPYAAAWLAKNPSYKAQDGA